MTARTTGLIFNANLANRGNLIQPMPQGSIIDTIPATSAAVFRLLHDYSRRLEWDTLLWLQWLLHPLMTAVFRWETQKRLAALRRRFTRAQGG